MLDDCKNLIELLIAQKVQGFKKYAKSHFLHTFDTNNFDHKKENKEI